METLKNGTISVREFVREGTNNSNKPMGTKTYQEWKDFGLKINRIVFVIKPEDPDTVYKLCFSAIASVPVGKAMTTDIPNFVTVFAVDEQQQSTDNGDFYVPKVKKEKPIETSSEAKVSEWLKRVKESFTYKREQASAPSVTEKKKDDGIPLEDIPF